MGKNAKSSDRSLDIEQIQSQRKETRRLYDQVVKLGYPELRGAVVIDVNNVVGYGNGNSFEWFVAQCTDIRLPYTHVFLEAEHGDKGLYAVHVQQINERTYRADLFEWSFATGKRGKAGVSWMIYLNEDGSFKDASTHFKATLALSPKWERIKAESPAPLFLAMMSLAFMNKGAKLVDHTPHIHPRLAKRRGTKPVTFKTLLLPKSRTNDAHDTLPKPYQGIVPEHARRGHPATYTEDAPLFGKFVGTFWRKPTVVGERKNGIVVKDYKVEPPNA